MFGLFLANPLRIIPGILEWMPEWAQSGFGWKWCRNCAQLVPKWAANSAPKGLKIGLKSSPRAVTEWVPSSDAKKCFRLMRLNSFRVPFVYKQIVKEIIRASFSTPKLILFLISLNVNNINPKLAIIIPAHPATETLSCRKNNEKIVINIGEHPLEIGYT